MEVPESEGPEPGAPVSKVGEDGNLNQEEREIALSPLFGSIVALSGVDDTFPY